MKSYDELRTYIEKRDPKTLAGYHLLAVALGKFSFKEFGTDIVNLVKYDPKLSIRRKVFENLRRNRDMSDTETRVANLAETNKTALYKDTVFSDSYHSRHGFGSDLDIVVCPDSVLSDVQRMAQIGSRKMNRRAYDQANGDITRRLSEDREFVNAVGSLLG